LERKVIIIVGPTCSGKTKLSLSLAKNLKSEIISADSRQVYKYLDIGTAKPSGQELKLVKHHFINTLKPDEEFNVSKFEECAVDIISNLHKYNKIPVVVGGSGLYIKALIDGIFNTANKDEDYRKELKEKMIEYGKEYLYEELKKVDLISAEKMLPQNWKRVMRALEVYHLTKEPIWKLQQEYNRNLNFEFHQYGLDWDREILYENIDQRVNDMIIKGLVDETKNVLNMGYNKKLNSLNTVGYKEIVSYLDNDITLEKAVELIKRNTRRFAKRQLTWFRKDERIKWISIVKNEDINEVSKRIP
jgi:tRNA dimethylallyltransferase